MPAAARAGERPTADDIERIARALGWRPGTFRPAAPDRGESSTAARWIVGEDGGPGRSAFVKIGATPITAEWFRTEARIYAELRGWYLPRVLGFDDDGERPALALEDLSEADWPPPWTDERVALVRGALDAIHGTAAPSGLDRMVNDSDQHWAAIARDPGPLLALGVCSAGWLDRSLPVLTDAATRAPLAGDALVHLDVRSDNLCFRAGGAIVIDWSHARLANPDLDVAFWLPSLESEGGPPPEAILPESPELAAWVAGFFCRWAGLPHLPDAPHVRRLQRSQAATALPWAARALGLPPPA